MQFVGLLDGTGGLFGTGVVRIVESDIMYQLEWCCVKQFLSFRSLDSRVGKSSQFLFSLRHCCSFVYLKLTTKAEYISSRLVD
jgi:hypothetical protein